MGEFKSTTCDLCGKVWDHRYSNPGFRKYTFHVGEVHDGYDRWENDEEFIVLCSKCQARVAKSLHGRGNIKFDMFRPDRAQNCSPAIADDFVDELLG
jgi:hypothetical protein